MLVLIIGINLTTLKHFTCRTDDVVFKFNEPKEVVEIIVQTEANPSVVLAPYLRGNPTGSPIVSDTLQSGLLSLCIVYSLLV